MTDETEIRLTAERFVERFGKDAPRQATIRANELRAVGHVEEYDIWMSIYTEVKSLLVRGRKSSKAPGVHITAGRTARIGVYSGSL